MLLLLDTKVCNLSSWINILKNLECKFIIAENSDFKHELVDRIIFPGVGWSGLSRVDVSEGGIRRSVFFKDFEVHTIF